MFKQNPQGSTGFKSFNVIQLKVEKPGRLRMMPTAWTPMAWTPGVGNASSWELLTCFAASLQAGQSKFLVRWIWSSH